MGKAESERGKAIEITPQKPVVEGEAVEDEAGEVPEGEVFDPNKGPNVASAEDVKEPPEDTGEQVGGSETVEELEAAGIDVKTEP